MRDSVYQFFPFRLDHLRPLGAKRKAHVVRCDDWHVSVQLSELCRIALSGDMAAPAELIGCLAR